jgi:iron(III) transport system ATP-binding protein
VFSFLNNAAAKRKERRPSHGRGKAAVTFAAQLTFEGVSRDFDGKLALDNVSLDVAPGEIVCLVGPSGCGKTTLLRIASGVERPSAGRVLIDGQEVAGPNRFVPPEKRGVGLMFQDFALFPHLSILDNVAFGLKSLTRSEAKLEALAALDRVGLAHYANEYPHILSGGEQQRVALARALANDPPIVLADEPTGNLDSANGRHIMDLLRDIHRTRGTTLVLVTHDAELAAQADARMVLRDGRVVDR